MSARHEWAESEESRFGIYLGPPSDQAPMYFTSKDGIGTALVQGREDGDVTGDTRIGILDGFTGEWVVNYYAKGAA